MKTSSLLLTILVLTAGTLTAQDQPKRPALDPAGIRDRQIKALTEQLQLTAEQQEKLKPIYDKQAEQMRVIYQDQNTTREEKGQQLQTLRTEALKQVKALLTKEQAEKFEKSQAAAANPLSGSPRAAKIAEDLGLKPEQKEKFIAVIQELGEQMRAIYQDQNTSREEKAAKMREVSEANQAKIKGMLTAEQFEKLTKFRAGAQPAPRPQPQPEKKN